MVDNQIKLQNLTTDLGDFKIYALCYSINLFNMDKPEPYILTIKPKAKQPGVIK